MGQTISSLAPRAVGRDAAGLVAKRLDPWSSGRCACISQTWNRGIQEVTADASRDQHWLVAAEGNSRLWMCNVVTGYEKVVKPDLPWASIEHADVPDDDDDEWLKFFGSPNERMRASRPWRVLCSFQGLVLLCLGIQHKHTLVLGDPFLNKWVKLPTPEWPPDFYFLPVAAFCPATNTVMVTTDAAQCTATFDLATAEWAVDFVYDREVFDPVGHACCLDGVFYCTCMHYPHETRGAPFLRDKAYCGIACYDPVNDRRWRIVREFRLSGLRMIFLAEQSRDKMLVYMVPNRQGAHRYELFEASKSEGSNELEIVPCPLMDDASIGKRIRLSLDCQDGPRNDGSDRYPRAIFHGKGDMFFWDSFYLDKVLALFLHQHGQGTVKELKGVRNNCVFPYSKCYYAPAPGTSQLLQDLAAKLQHSSTT